MCVHLELRKENPTKKNIPTLDGKAVVEAIKICKVPVLKITANGTNRNNNTVGIYCHGGKYVSGCAEVLFKFSSLILFFFSYSSSG